MLTSVIIENEPLNQKTLLLLLKDYSGEKVKNLGVAATVDEGVQLIRTCKPDLLFLDVELNWELGFEALDQLGDMDLQVIMVTAFREYAIKALQYAAVDYLLKPIDPDELQAAIARAEKAMAKRAAPGKEASSAPRLSLNSHSGMHLLDVSRILLCEADGNYTRVVLTEGEQTVVSKPLKEFAALLPQGKFFRVHRSFIANLDRVSSFRNHPGCVLRMENGLEIPVSRRRSKQVRSLLKGISTAYEN